MKQSIDKYITDALTDYGKGVNTERQLVLEMDGLKPVYRRAIYTALQLGNKLFKTAAISGTCISKYHPHSSDSVDAVISALVRWGIFEGQGNHGLKMIYGDDIVPAASRYTEAKLSESWRQLLSDLMPYVPYKEAEMEGNMEPLYLPTPIPLILLSSGLGISYGVNARYPMFTPQSLFNALVNNDPSLLEAPGGLIIDKDLSELDSLWDTGLGKITYKYKVEKCGISTGYGSMISGSAEIFKPNLSHTFQDEYAKGQIYILDQTSGDIPKVFIGKSPNVRAIDLQDIQDKCEQACKFTKTFRLTVTDGDTAYIIPLRQWLSNCYGNYIRIVSDYIQDQLKQLKFEYDVYTWLPIIAECLINHRDYDAETLASVNKCDIEIVKSILRKSISTLRNTDCKEKLTSLQSKIDYFNNLTPQDYTIELIKNL